MNATTAHITETSILFSQRNDFNRVATVATESRPASLADADTFLAFHGYGRTGAWDLAGVGLSAPVTQIDNMFNGVRAARLDQAVGTTHDEFEVAFADSVMGGDLISDMELSEIYVVAGGSLSDTTQKIHMVGEMKTWEDRYTTDFPRHQLVQVARKR